MIEQLSLPTARASDPPTSHEAAASIPSGLIEREIMEAFVHRFSVLPNRTECGMTDDQLCRYLSIYYAPTVKSARSRLTKAGRLINSGRTAPSSRGKPSIVWRLP